MAKISTIKYTFQGKELIANVNVNSQGEFSCNIPEDIAKALNLRMKITSYNLGELESNFRNSLKRYKEAETKLELYILIRYHACGEYSCKSDGSVLFGNNSIYQTKCSFSEFRNAVGIDYMVAFKKTVDGVVNWHKGISKRDRFESDANPYEYVNGYRIDNQKIFESKTDLYKKIPFNQDALNTIKSAQEQFRKLSETLFNFMEKDEEQILLALSNKKLLN